jgi:hypothetical protein
LLSPIKWNLIYIQYNVGGMASNGLLRAIVETEIAPRVH